MALVADIPQAIQTGLQLRQQEQLAPIQQQTAQLGLEQKQQALQLGGLQQQNVQGQIDQRTDKQKTRSLINTALTVDTLTNDQLTSFFEKNIADVQAKGGIANESIQALGLANAGRFDEIRNTAKNIVDIGVRQGDVSAQAVTKEDVGFTLSAGQQRFDASGRLIASVAPKEAVSDVKTEAVIPEVLLQGLDPELSVKGSAAFTAAGGGKDGLKAFQEIIDKGTEQQRRLASPAILKSNFPQASRAEQAQLQGVMDAAKTTESGLKAANKVRVEQKRLKKAAGFQDRAIELLDGILASGEGFLGGDLGDVLGSIEGRIDLRIFSDDEAQIIADIEEAGNILTADNLDLMSGVLSETDIKILKNLAGGALSRTRTKERFVADVTKLRDKLASQKVVTIDERDAAQAPSEGATATGPGGEKAVFTNGQWVIQNAG